MDMMSLRCAAPKADMVDLDYSDTTVINLSCSPTTQTTIFHSSHLETGLMYFDFVMHIVQLLL